MTSHRHALGRLLLATSLVAGPGLTPDAAQAARAPGGLRKVVHAGKAKALKPQARRQLAQQEAAVVEGHEQHFFALYDRNVYQGIPSFVTVDTVLHVFHLRFDELVAQAERETALPLLRTFARAQAQRALALKTKDPRLQQRLRLLAAYHGVALALLEPGGTLPLDSGASDPWLRKNVDAEVARIVAANGSGSSAICPRGMDYSLFKPRGHYDRFDLDRYFRAVTFYAQCAFDLSAEAGQTRAIDVARLLDASARTQLETLVGFVTLLAGAPDDIDAAALERLHKGPLPPINAKLTTAARQGLAAKLKASRPGRVPAQAGPAELSPPLFRLLGAAATADSALFARSADWQQGRPFPSGLDLLAALGSDDARGLLQEETRRLPGLAAAIDAGLPVDAQSLYGRWLEVLREVLKRPGPEHPTFEQSPVWQRHLTVAAAGSWAELRHDTLLYVKQPMVWAQGGHGDELPAVKAAGYVEPRPEVYRKLRALLDTIAQRLPQGAKQASRSKVGGLGDLLDFLTRVAELELAGAPFPREADARLRQIGAELERLTLGHGDELPPQALIADVYSHADAGGEVQALHVGIGNVDELWVVVPRAGRRVLMRGGVFSYYELVGEPGERISDREWASRLRSGKMPERPAWARPLPGKARRKPLRRGAGH